RFEDTESRHDDRNVEGRDARNGFDADRREDDRHREDHHDVDRHEANHQDTDRRFEDTESRHDNRKVEGRDARNGFDADRREDD
ncbi:hypothetical protein WL578_12710, partial [Staphylococcus epidermidis]